MFYVLFTQALIDSTIAEKATLYKEIYYYYHYFYHGKSNQIKNFINVPEIFSLQAASWGHMPNNHGKVEDS